MKFDLALVSLALKTHHGQISALGTGSDRGPYGLCAVYKRRLRAPCVANAHGAQSVLTLRTTK